MRVLCLTLNLYDRNTKIQFEPCTPFVAKTETDRLGHDYVYQAFGVAEIDPTETVVVLGEPITLLDYFRSRNKTHAIVEPAADSPVGDDYEAVQRAGPWWDVLGPDGVRANDKAIPEDAARELAAKLNAEGG